MHDVIELFGWFVFNVAIPLFAPFALLPLVLLSHPVCSCRESIFRLAVKDGQLLWAVIPMSAGGCYMLASALDVPGAYLQGMWVMLALHVILIVAASVLVTIATTNAYWYTAQRQSRRGPTTRIPLVSTVVSLASGGLHFVGYVWLVRPIAAT
nr:hypothetical protein [uncultured Cupriavidus sp.]